MVSSLASSTYSTAEAAERAAVLAETLSWERTAFHHAGGVKIKLGPDGSILDRGGADCVSSIYLIYRAALPGRVPEIDIPGYSYTWHMHKHTAEQELYLKGVMSHAREVATPQPGDMVLYHWAHAWAHGGIVMAWPDIMHMSVDGGGFIRDRGDAGRLAGRRKRFFSLW